MDADVIVIREGSSLYLFRPQSEDAREWLAEHVQDGTWFGDSLAVEHRYGRDLADGMRADGLTVA